MTAGVPSSTTATHEFVVPRSIPMTLSAICLHPSRLNELAQFLELRADFLVCGLELHRPLEGLHGPHKLPPLAKHVGQDPMSGGLFRRALRRLYTIFLRFLQLAELEKHLRALSPSLP